MKPLVDAFKYSLVPGSDWFLLVAASCGLALLFARPRAGRLLLTAVIVGYWALSTPLVARWLEAGLERGYPRLERPADLQGVTAIVVLGAGSATYSHGGRRIDLMTMESTFSALEAARLFRLGGGTALVITSGGRPLPEVQLEPESRVVRDALVGLGVPPDRIVEESQSLNTYEQARNLRPMLAGHRVGRFVLVASATHLWRAMKLFQAQQLAPVPAPSPLQSDQGMSWRDEWWPSNDALRASRSCAYHYMAMMYALARGWMHGGTS